MTLENAKATKDSLQDVFHHLNMAKATTATNILPTIQNLAQSVTQKILLDDRASSVTKVKIGGTVGLILKPAVNLNKRNIQTLVTKALNIPAIALHDNPSNRTGLRPT